MKMERRIFLELSGLALAATAVRGRTAKAQRPLPKSEFDYVDWSWQRWREITGQTRPNVRGEQSGKAELIYLHEKNGKPLTTAREWDARCESTKRLLSEFLGTSPKSKPLLEPMILEETTLDTYTRRKLSYQTEPGERVPSYLLIPKNLRGRAPVVLCPHQTTTPLTSGKRDPIGLNGDLTLHTA